MNHKLLGIALIATGILLFLSVYSYTTTIMSLSAELHKNCPLPEEVCPYKKGIPVESYHGFFLSGVVVVAGFYLMFSKKQPERVVVAEKPSVADRSKIKKAIESLKGEEKQVLQMIADSDGAMFQSDITQKTGFSKVKTSRILDRLEVKGLIERKRRGMTNLIVIKVA